MRLIHYHHSPILKLYEKEYPIELLNHKPGGLWVSVEGLEDDTNWKDWCVAENFGLENLKMPHLLTLKKTANVLFIQTAEKLDEFNKEFGISLSEYYKITFGLNRQTPGYEEYVNQKGYSIRWNEVKKKWDGLIIAPYQWENRLGMSWYYGWDCASGCIWNIGCIDEFYPIIIVNSFENKKVELILN